MLSLLAHSDAALRPHDLAGAWNLDPLVVGGLAVAAWCYRRGWRAPTDTAGRRAAFALGLAAVAIAVVSPLDALSGALVSAHMVQHVLLVVVAAPLLAVSAPSAALVRGAPERIRTRIAPVRRFLRVDAAVLRRSRALVPRWLAYVLALWLWHASVLYGLAVENRLVHALEHATFLGTALLVWSSILGPARTRAPRELGLIAVFALALQTVFLSALLTFSTSPWYEPYLTTTTAWGLDPLEDQHLAGVIMWVPAGIVHVGIGIWLLSAWLREIDRSTATDAAPRPETVA